MKPFNLPLIIEFKLIQGGIIFKPLTLNISFCQTFKVSKKLNVGNLLSIQPSHPLVSDDSAKWYRWRKKSFNVRYSYGNSNSILSAEDICLLPTHTFLFLSFFILSLFALSRSRTQPHGEFSLAKGIKIRFLGYCEVTFSLKNRHERASITKKRRLLFI